MTKEQTPSTQEPPDSFWEAFNKLSAEQIRAVAWECLTRMPRRDRLLLARDILRELAEDE